MIGVKRLVTVTFVYIWSIYCPYLTSASSRNPSDDIIDLDHEYLTYDSYHDNDDIDTIKYYFRSDKTNDYLPLKRNLHIDLNSPVCFSEGDKFVCEYGTYKQMHFYHDDNHQVSVAIANINGTMKLSGAVHLDNQTHEIEPLESESLPSNRYHVIKKRWTANVIPSREKRGTRRSSRRNKNRRTSRRRQSRKSRRRKSRKCRRCKGGVSIDIGIQVGQRPQKPPSRNPPPAPARPSEGLCVDILCVVDYSIYKKFKEAEKSDSAAIKKIRYYYAHVISGINMRFGTSSLGINVRLAGYYIAKSPGDLPFINSNKMAKDPKYRVDNNKTLKSMAKYLKKLQKNKRAGILPDYNHAMLFLQYAPNKNAGGSVLGGGDCHIDESVYQYAFQHGEPKKGVSGDDGGTSYVGGICSNDKGTSLVVDHGAYTSSGIGTHELGHNLGVMHHDGEGTARTASCSAAMNYLMAPASYLIDPQNLRYSFTFSPCSMSQIKEHVRLLNKLNRNCMQCSSRSRSSKIDRETDIEVQKHLLVPPGGIDDVHTQCQQLYGKDSFMCPPNNNDEMCFRMYCYDPTRRACAIMSEQMAAEGTPCGKKKVCKMGKCVYDKDAGKDVPDACPYPDLPSSVVHCEDASRFMCQNIGFKQKCCNSCSQEFTDETSCKNTHVLINNMNCDQLVDEYGSLGCVSNENMRELCCRGCKIVMQVSMPIGSSFQLAVQAGRHSVNVNAKSSYNRRPPSRRRQPPSRRRPPPPSRRRPPPPSRRRPSPPPPRRRPQPPRRQNAPTIKSRPAASGSNQGSCIDNPRITVNGLKCPEFVKENEAYCTIPEIRIKCCGSCIPHS